MNYCDRSSGTFWSVIKMEEIIMYVNNVMYLFLLFLRSQVHHAAFGR